MPLSRYTLTLAIALSVTSIARAQAHKLAEADLASFASRIEIKMTLDGEVRVQQEGKTLNIKRLATGQHDYFERILAISKTGLPEKTARFYKVAKVTLDDGHEKSQRSFRPERSFIVSQRTRDRLLSFSPKGPLTHEELELTEHFDSMAIPGILPGREVEVGDSWKVANAAVQALCSLEALISHELSCKFTKVEGDVAHLLIGGSVKGIELGGEVKLNVTATATFDLKKSRITRVDWQQHDEREQGPVTPAFKADVTLTIVRTPLDDPPAEINDLALVPVPEGTPPEHLTALSFTDYKDRFTFNHGRAWQMVAPTEEHVVLRLMDRGDFVAQATLTPWKKAAAGMHLSPDEFHDAMINAPAWEQIQELEKVKKVNDAGANQVFRYAAEGTLNGIRVVQYYYLVAGEQGDQLVVTFTMTPQQAAKLGSQDIALVRSITFPALKSASAP